MTITTTWDPKSPPPARTTDIWMIWVLDDAPWLLDAWDQPSVSGNEEGWDEAVATAVKAHGGDNVRIAKTSIDYDKLLSSFKPVEV